MTQKLWYSVYEEMWIWSLYSLSVSKKMLKTKQKLEIYIQLTLSKIVSVLSCIKKTTSVYQTLEPWIPRSTERPIDDPICTQ